MKSFRRLAAVTALSIGTSMFSPSTLFASSPSLRLDCGIPDARNIVACQLSGRGFHSQEMIQITYRLTFTSLPRQHGRLPETVYRRSSITNSHGVFTRPPLKFEVIRYHESFRLHVGVSGTTGDRASTTYVAIAQ